MKNGTTSKTSYRQALSQIRQLSERNKEKLFEELRKEQLKKLFTKLRKKVVGISISDEEIMEEVKAVRRERYERKNRTEKKIEELLIEGYKSEAQEELKLTKEFEYADFENWPSAIFELMKLVIS